LIHVRQYAVEGFPTKMGFAFPAGRFKQLVNSFDQIDKAINSLKENKEMLYKSHLGGGWYVTVATGYYVVNLRRFWVPPGTQLEVPTKAGICLRFSEWRELKKAVMEMYGDRKDLADVEPCNMSFAHQNLLDYLDCIECCPFKNEECENELRELYGLYN